MSKKKLGLSIFILVILVLTVAVPVFAGGKDPVGTRVSFWNGDQTVSGPFNVLHGYAFPPPSSATGIGKTGFVLEIDGVTQDGRFLSFKIEDVLVQATLYNFPDGLPPGDYEFKGTWDDLCWMLWEWGQQCDGQKNDVVPYVATIQVTVD